jgi:hypothetical protein
MEAAVVFVKVLFGGLLGLTISACTAIQARPAGGFSWLEGCWETASGDYREVWRAEGTHVFGFAVTYKDGAEVFFEQARIDLGDVAVFSAYPAGKGPTQFVQIADDAASVTFENAVHDYPQRIAYARTGKALTAVISLADGSKAETFTFRACPV